MRPVIFAGVAMLMVFECGVAGPPPQALLAPVTVLSATQKAAIGRKIWHNECAGTVDGLTTWNTGEEFPSLGIGHFIWYPADKRGRFNETWPQFVAFAKQRGVALPAVALAATSPWSSKAEFQQAFKGPQMTGLRNWLATQVGVQTDFILARSRAALPKMLATAPVRERARIEANYRKLSATPNGTYALIDYVNFKGDGSLATERYKGVGWGLLQVLAGMRDVAGGQVAAAEFAASAKRVLARRIANSPPERGEKRWLEGWCHRCDTYARPL
ncbi:MAG: hypothetical protein DVB25_02010 [Verrucomicrobia bacterium]|nr:MAG: hypothetical protein DVB25_02010 [Verrucomicrobiota bacterium]